jgi:hypothetical protein
MEKAKTGAMENKKCLQLLMDSILLQIVFPFFFALSTPLCSIYMQIFHTTNKQTEKKWKIFL